MSYDHEETLTYLQPYHDIEYYQVQKKEIAAPPRDASFSQGFRLFYPNIYLNELLSRVKDGFIIFLPDDDCFMTPDAPTIIDQTITSENDLIFWQVKFSAQCRGPDAIHFDQQPTLHK